MQLCCVSLQFGPSIFLIAHQSKTKFLLFKGSFEQIKNCVYSTSINHFALEEFRVVQYIDEKVHNVTFLIQHPDLIHTTEPNWFVRNTMGKPFVKRLLTSSWTHPYSQSRLQSGLLPMLLLEFGHRGRRLVLELSVRFQRFRVYSFLKR